ncbi:hypothetical protein ACWKWN_16175 [Microbacterium trichothecenolyticum]
MRERRRVAHDIADDIPDHIADDVGIAFGLSEHVAVTDRVRVRHASDGLRQPGDACDPAGSRR